MNRGLSTETHETAWHHNRFVHYESRGPSSPACLCSQGPHAPKLSDTNYIYDICKRHVQAVSGQSGGFLFVACDSRNLRLEVLGVEPEALALHRDALGRGNRLRSLGVVQSYVAATVIGGLHRVLGVTVGDGAIIGANSVVGKDVEPYTIVVGNPAKVLRKRFDDELIGLPLAFKWWDKGIEEINALIPLLTCSDLDKVKKELTSRLA